MSGSVTAGWAIHRHGTPSWSVENLVSYLRCEKTISGDYTWEVIGDEYTPEDLAQKKCNYQTELITCLTVIQLTISRVARIIYALGHEKRRS
ncbi:hypothetical protein ANCDUO_09597 [Ancylostoma duodenale]|uniref:Uncharacterized protein n=1 Tax=Ancylostoma duodenale TaxID=51022 RepID=A0A0C2GSR5_9BILA|nr:hypothetical protein ANCDUO_09597 [Ancylostoma duodenale]